MSCARSHRGRAAGVTLVELMIAVAIVGILAAIAYPSYRQQVLRGARTDGKAELLRAAQDLEKCFTRFGAYNSGNCDAFDDLSDEGRPSENRRYQISLANADATTYLLQAVPQGGQVQDELCGTLQIDQSGLRDQTGEGEVAQCW